METKQKTIGILKFVLFILLTLCVASCLVDGISLDWTGESLRPDDLYLKLIIDASWAIFSFGLFALGIIVSNFFCL